MAEYQIEINYLNSNGEYDVLYPKIKDADENSNVEIIQFKSEYIGTGEDLNEKMIYTNPINFLEYDFVITDLNSIDSIEGLYVANVVQFFDARSNNKNNASMVEGTTTNKFWAYSKFMNENGNYYMYINEMGISGNRINILKVQYFLYILGFKFI